MSNDSYDRDPDELRFFVRRIDQRWRLTATGDGLEHTHSHGFLDKDDAHTFRRQVRWAYENGRELNLAHWDTVAV
jgi:hypothetical protein